MAIIYSAAAINARLNGVVTAIDGGGGAGQLRLYAGALLVSTITLAVPCGVVAGGILTFTVPAIDPNSAGGGIVTTATITDFTGALMISGFTVGVPLSGAEIIVSNGQGTLLIVPGQVITLVAGQIIGS